MKDEREDSAGGNEPETEICEADEVLASALMDVHEGLTETCHEVNHSAIEYC